IRYDLVTGVQTCALPISRLDTRALPACKASDSKMLRLGPRACPSATKLGSGSTQAIAGPSIAFQTVVTLFNARKQIIVLVQVNRSEERRVGKGSGVQRGA